MKIKYSPTRIDNQKPTQINKIDENTIEIDGEQHYFPPDIEVYEVEYPLAEVTRDFTTKELFIILRISYNQEVRSVWETPNENGKYKGEEYEDL